MSLLSVIIVILLAAPAAKADVVTDGRVIGHRGMGAHHAPEPENSIRALISALQQGASAVEFDVQLSRDGQVILAHDLKLDRMTNGTGCVAETDFADLKKLSLRDGEGKVAGERMATFRDALEAIRVYDDGKRPVLADIHLKIYDRFKGDWGGWWNRCPRTKYAELARKTLEITKSLGLVDRVIFTAFDKRTLDLIRKIEPTAKVGLLGQYRPAHTISVARGRQYNAVGLSMDHMSVANVREAHKHGLLVYVWSPSKQHDMEKFFAEHKVDAVITDNISNALQACKNSCYNSKHE